MLIFSHPEELTTEVLEKLTQDMKNAQVMPLYFPTLSDQGLFWVILRLAVWVVSLEFCWLESGWSVEPEVLPSEFWSIW